MRNPRLLGRALRRDQRGVASVFNLFLTIAACMVGAIALDVSHLFAARSQLQTAADLGAHAALYTRRYGAYENRGNGPFYYSVTDDAARAAAIAAVQVGAPVSELEAVITPGQVILGNYDFATRRVIPDTTPPIQTPDAAVVMTQRANTNPVGTFLFRIIGLRSVNVRAAAVFTLGPASCDGTQGFFSRRQVEINGNNLFQPGFCVGSPIVRIRNNNEFRPGVAVVTETPRGLELSNSDVVVRNPGLMDAFSTGATAYAPIKSFMDAELDEVTTILTGLPTTIADYANHRYAYNLLGKPGWTQVVSNRNAPPNVQLATNPTVPLTGGRTYLPTELAANRVNVITCSGGGGNGRVTLLGSGTNNVFRNMAVFTNCQVRFDGNAVLEDFVLSTTDRSSSGQWAIHTASGLTVGRNDGCAPAGGAALITRGGFQAAAQTSFYGAIVRAVEEVDFQSNAVGEGVSIISGGGKVDTNSNINMAVCGPDSGAPPRNVSLRMRM